MAEGEPIPSRGGAEAKIKLARAGADDKPGTTEAQKLPYLCDNFIKDSLLGFIEAVNTSVLRGKVFGSVQWDGVG